MTQTEHRPRLGVALSIGLALALLGTWYLDQQGVAIWLGWVLSLSVITLVMFGIDKAAARRQGPRVSERALLGMSLLGGSPGAFAGMSVFRHKTLKSSFRRSFWFVVTLQVTGLGVLWWLQRDA